VATGNRNGASPVLRPRVLHSATRAARDGTQPCTALPSVVSSHRGWCRLAHCRASALESAMLVDPAATARAVSVSREGRREEVLSWSSAEVAAPSSWSPSSQSRSSQRVSRSYRRIRSRKSRSGEAPLLRSRERVRPCKCVKGRRQDTNKRECQTQHDR